MGYDNECPQLVDKETNPLSYDIFAEDEHCSQCYDEYECDAVSICIPSNLNNCGVCSLVTCYGNINDAADLQNVLEGSNAVPMWWRSLLMVTAASMLVVCCWGSCYMSKPMLRRRQSIGGENALRNEMIPVS